MRRLAQFVRLRASRVSRLRLSRVCSHLSHVGRLVSRLHLSASVSRASRVCLRLFTSRVSNACVGRLVSRLSRVGRLVSHLSRICRLVSRRSSCLASVSHLSSCLASVVLSRVGRLVSRLFVCPCECLRELAHFMRRSSFKEFKRFFAIDILSYNVPMPKYPSHHLIYVFYHPMPIMPLY